MNHFQRKLKDMDWELKSLDNNFEVTDYDEQLRPALVGYQGNEEKVLYTVVDGETLVRSDADQEKEDDLTFEELKSNKFDEIPSEVVTSFLEKITSNTSEKDEENKNSLNGEKPINQNQDTSDNKIDNNSSDNITRF